MYETKKNYANTNSPWFNHEGRSIIRRAPSQVEAAIINKAKKCQSASRGAPRLVCLQAKHVNHLLRVCLQKKRVEGIFDICAQRDVL